MEKLQIEMDFRTVQALLNLKELLATLDQVKTDTKETGQAVDAAEQAVDGLGVSAKQTGNEVKQAGDKVKDFGNDAVAAGAKAKKSIDDVDGPTAALGKTFGNLGSEVRNWIGGFVGLQGVIQLIQLMNDELKDTIQLRERLISEKMTFDQKLQGFVANLGLPNTAAGQDQARQILERLAKRAPASSLDSIMQMAGQFQAFGFDVTQPGEAEDIFSVAAGMAASMQLTPEEAGAIPNVAKAVGVRDAAGMQFLLAQIKAAQKTTPIANQSDFTKQFLRLAAQFMPQGMSVEQVAGLLAGSTPGSTDPRVVGTNAEQAMRAAMGKDAEAQAALAEQAVAQGVITPEALAAAVPDFLSSEMKKKEDQFGAARRRIEDAQNRMIDRAAADETAGKQDEQAISAAKGNKQKLELIELRRRDRATKRLREDQDAREVIQSAQKTMTDIQTGTIEKATSLAAAQAFRALPAGAKLDVALAALSGKSQAEQTEFVTQSLKASQEETGALLVLAGGGASVGQAARSAVTTVGPDQMVEIDADIQGFISSPLGQQQAALTQTEFDRSRSVTAEEQIAKTFKDRSLQLADIFIKQYKNLPPAAQKGFSFTTNEMTRFIFYQRQVIRQMYMFLTDMSDEERRAHPDIQFLITAVAKLSYDPVFTSSAYEKVDDAYRRFVYSARAVVADRTRGRFPSRTMSAPPDIVINDSSSSVADQNFTIISSDPTKQPINDQAIDEAMGTPLAPLHVSPEDALNRFPDAPGPQSRSAPLPDAFAAGGSMFDTNDPIAAAIAADQIRHRRARTTGVRKPGRPGRRLSEMSDSELREGFARSSELDQMERSRENQILEYIMENPASWDEGPNMNWADFERRVQWERRAEQERKAQAGEGRIIVDGASYTPPATEPGTISVNGQPVNQGNVTNYYYTINPGNMFVGNGGDLDLPGPLEHK